MTRKAATAKPKSKTPDRPEPSPALKVAMAEAVNRQAARPKRVRLARPEDSKPDGVTSPHSDMPGWAALLGETFGTVSSSFTAHNLGLLEIAVRGRGAPQGGSLCHENAALAMIGAFEAKDEIEAALAAQLTTVHFSALELMGLAKHQRDLQHLQAYVGMATKLQRTFVAGIEALAKLRGGGKQEVRVTHEHRHIYINGNAVVGDVHAGGGGGSGGFGGRNAGQSHAAGLLDAPGGEVWSEDQIGLAMPVACGAGAEEVPDARRDKPGRAHRSGERAMALGPSLEGIGERQAPDQVDDPGDTGDVG